MAASAMPSRARFLAVQVRAAKIRKSTDASSRKSTLSAKKRHGPDRHGDGELDPKIGKIHKCNEPDRFSYGAFVQWLATPAVML
jgi:hypothetical protein